MMYSLANTSDSMVLGSPVSANSSTHQPQFLPGYLLGDASFSGAASPITPQRLWTPGGGHSPPKSNASRLMSPPSQHHHSGLLVSPRSELRLSGRDYSHRAKDKSGAPPVMGLFDQITSPIPAQSSIPSFHRSTSMNMDGSYMPPVQMSVVDHDASYQQQTSRQPIVRSDVPTSGLFSPHGDMSLMTSPGRQTPPSPPQVDPFYTQGESIRPDDRLDETWVTVFGFSAAAASFILQQFSQYGNIIQHVVAPEGNWMHLHYQSKIQAKKALSKNGKVFGNGIMVGVQSCIDKNLMEQNRDFAPNLSTTGTSTINNTSHLMSPEAPVQQIGALDNSYVKRTPNMRLLTSAYRAPGSDQDVLNNTPQKSSSVIGKALEYMFGW